jgi:Flp pilus assembly pilin Flp
MKRRHRFPLLRDRRGFTRLEFGLLAAMLLAMVVNGVATLGGGLGSASHPVSVAQPAGVSNAAASMKR